MIPQFTRGDRLRKARNLTGLSTRDFAEKIGVSQKTVTDAENDHRPQIRKILLNAWALATGVPTTWLETGNAPAQPQGPGGGEEDARSEGLEPPACWFVDARHLTPTGAAA